MSYKRLITSQRLRIKILEFLSWIPDSLMVRLQYRISVGRVLNLRNPQRFTEKIQWYKLNYRDDRLWKCVDKFEVHKYLTQRGYSDYLNEIYGVYNDIEDVDFNTLPNKFVVKTTSGGGSVEVFICNENSLKNQEKIKAMFKGKGGKHLKKPIAREWSYQNMPPTRIIVEKFIESADGLSDYKFYCFNGKPYYCQVIGNRGKVQNAEFTVDFFDMDWTLMPFRGLTPNCISSETPIEKPLNFDKMKRLVAELSEDFPFVRVDMYNTDGKIIFGELTFYPSSGYGQFTPDEFDYKMGQLFDLQTVIGGG